jgi:Zn-finger nucleic acid-binding protein
MILCPHCKVELHKKHLKGVAVEECPTCRGIFFDEGELERVKNAEDNDLRWINFKLFGTKDQSDATGDQLDCPKCGFPLSPIQYGKSKATIHRCTNCHGVWLDKGEFEKILDYLRTMVARESSSDLADDWKKELKDVLSGGPKSESEELRDLMAVTRLLEERWSVEHPVVEKLLTYYYELTPFK